MLFMLLCVSQVLRFCQESPSLRSISTSTRPPFLCSQAAHVRACTRAHAHTHTLGLVGNDGGVNLLLWGCKRLKWSRKVFGGEWQFAPQHGITSFLPLAVWTLWTLWMLLQLLASPESVVINFGKVSPANQRDTLWHLCVYALVRLILRLRFVFKYLETWLENVLQPCEKYPGKSRDVRKVQNTLRGYQWLFYFE